MAQGHVGTNSKRPTQYVEGIYPTHIDRASQCYVWDTNGRRYIDFVGGLGSVILGYNHPKVNEAVKKQLSTGLVTGSFPSTIEVETAEMIQDMFPACEKIRFLKNGSDATDAAVRIARSVHKTGLVISEGYHGSTDFWTSLTPPAIGCKDVFYNNTYDPLMELKEEIFITEPVALDVSETRKKFLKNVKKKNNIIIHDEIITGCRFPEYSVHRSWQLEPDIVCLGKAIANGFALSVVGGKKEIMDAKEYFISKTFSGEAVSIAACNATLTELKRKSMNELWKYANIFMNKFNDICKDIDVSLEGYGTRGMLKVKNVNTALLMQECEKGGILFGKAFFYHFGHLESGTEEYVFNIISDAVYRIKLGAVKLEGKMPRDTFTR